MKSYYRSLILILLLLSCKENSVESIDNNSFSLELQVKDGKGNVLPNINVSIWNKINSNQGLRKVTSSTHIQAATTIRYDLFQKCFVDLSFFDLNGLKKGTFVHGQYNAGAYELQSDWSENNNGVFKVKLITSSDFLKNNVLFVDSIYVVIIHSDPIMSVVGQTDPNGKIKITNKLLFPNLYKLPPIVRTLENSPDPIGDFTFSDSITIALSDESFSKTILYKRAIINGGNNFSLKWDNTLLKSEINGNNFYNKLRKHVNILKVDTVVLSTFSASVVNNEVVLNWQTINERNNYGFEIQKCKSGNQLWTMIGFVQGKGTTNETQNYSFTDKNVSLGIYRYRLKQIDFDSSFEFSNEIEAAEIFLSIKWKLHQNYPNPFN